MLERGATIRKSGAQHAAVIEGRIDTLKILLYYGADLNELGDRKIYGDPPGKCAALHYAAKNGHLKTVDWLLRNGAVSDLKSSEGKTAKDFWPDENGEVDWSLGSCTSP